MSDDERRSSASGKLYLDMPVNYLKGVGPMRAEGLRKLGIVTARDLLFHVPHRYEDAEHDQSISSLEPGMDATVVGQVILERNHSNEEGPANIPGGHSRRQPE